MKRYTALRLFLSCLKPNDVLIFSGEDLCKEAFRYDKPSYFYVTGSYGVVLPMSIGLAMTTEKRIFVCVGEGEFIGQLSSAAQAAVSNCRNLFYVVFDNGGYQSTTGTPTIYNEVGSIKSIIHGMGFLVHDFTNGFADKQTTDSTRGFIKNIKGPMTIQIRVDKGLKKDLEDIIYSKLELKERFVKFINDKSLGTSRYGSSEFVSLDIGGKH